MAEDFDFNTIVADAARRIENRTGVIVSAEARQVLLSRAQEHRSDVARAVAEQGLTASDLVNAAERQLQEAVPYIDQPRGSEQQQQQGQQQQMQQQQMQQQQMPNRPPGQIGARAVHDGMRSKCWFVPWC